MIFLDILDINQYYIETDFLKKKVLLAY